MTVRFGFTTVLPPYAGAEQQEAVVARYAEILVSLGGSRREMADYDDPAPLVFLIATGGTERALLGLHARRQASFPGEPVLLVTHPGNNSLPAALEVLARLQQDGARGRIVHLRDADDERGISGLREALHDVQVRGALRTARVGLVGAPSDWLVASSPPSAVVREVWGPEVVAIGMDEFKSAIAAADATGAKARAAAFESEAVGRAEPLAEDLSAASRVNEGLRAVVARHALTAVTVRCFDLVVEDATSGCFALSDLTDSGVIAGCEGDLVSTVTMLWANLLLGAIPWMANPADIDESDNILTLAHCTVPRSLVETYRLRSHFESGLGVGIQGMLPLGPVTLLRLGGSMLDQLWLAEGEVVSCGDAENLCRTQVHIALSRGDVRDLLAAPLGNHIVMVRGHHADRLASWRETML